VSRQRNDAWGRALVMVASAVWVVTVVTGCSGGSLDQRLDTGTPTTVPPPTVAPSATTDAGQVASGSMRGNTPGRSTAVSTSAARTTMAGAAGSGGMSIGGGTRTGSGAGAGGWWRPASGVSWQVQYSGTLDTSVAAQVYDLDVGSSESYRSDAGAFRPRCWAV
jgi:hypothetical protein